MNYPAWKRIEDFLGATLAALAVVPFLPFLAVAIKTEYPKEPILVRLPRVSEGEIIKVYKFRSMVPNAHLMKESLKHLNERKDGPFFKISSDPRVTPVGRILRKFRIDELPQLINVFKGELALVGPRPHEPLEVAEYPDKYKNIPLARAGITGASQVNGASSLPFLKELEIDSAYINNFSIWTDIKILAKTFLLIFTDKNAV